MLQAPRLIQAPVLPAISATMRWQARSRRAFARLQHYDGARSRTRACELAREKGSLAGFYRPFAARHAAKSILVCSSVAG
jgi:hypothetical protein